MTSWVRLWLDMPTDPKWRTIARRSGQPLTSVIALYTYLLCIAGSAVPAGDVSAINIEDAATALDMDEDAVSSILAAMEGRVISAGRLSGWEKRQPKREDDSSQRVKRHRETQKLTQRNDVKRTVTHGNAPESESDTESESSSKEDDDFLDCVGDIARAAGVPVADPGSVHQQRLMVQSWINAGATPKLIEDTCRAVSVRAKRPPRTLAYFDNAVREAIATLAGPGPAASPASKIGPGTWHDLKLHEENRVPPGLWSKSVRDAYQARHGREPDTTLTDEQFGAILPAGEHWLNTRVQMLIVDGTTPDALPPDLRTWFDRHRDYFENAAPAGMSFADWKTAQTPAKERKRA